MLPMWWQPVSFVSSVGGCKATVNFERFLPGPVTPYRSSAGARREPDTQRISAMAKVTVIFGMESGLPSMISCLVHGTPRTAACSSAGGHAPRDAVLCVPVLLLTALCRGPRMHHVGEGRITCAVAKGGSP